MIEDVRGAGGCSVTCNAVSPRLQALQSAGVSAWRDVRAVAARVRQSTAGLLCPNSSLDPVRSGEERCSLPRWIREALPSCWLHNGFQLQGVERGCQRGVCRVCGGCRVQCRAVPGQRAAGSRRAWASLCRRFASTGIAFLSFPPFGRTCFFFTSLPDEHVVRTSCNSCASKNSSWLLQANGAGCRRACRQSTG